MYSGWTPQEDHQQFAAMTAAGRLLNKIGVSAYLAWARAQAADGVLPWKIGEDYNWSILERLATDEYNRLTLDDCDCNGANRDGCALCAPSSTGELLF